MSALDSFLAEMKKKDGPLADDPNCYQGNTYAALEKWFRFLETADTDRAIDLYGPVGWCVSQRRYTVPQRLVALGRLREKYDAGLPIPEGICRSRL